MTCLVHTYWSTVGSGSGGDGGARQQPSVEASRWRVTEGTQWEQEPQLFLESYLEQA
jgi:hypothetical protein